MVVTTLGNTPEPQNPKCLKLEESDSFRAFGDLFVSPRRALDRSNPKTPKPYNPIA